MAKTLGYDGKGAMRSHMTDIMTHTHGSQSVKHVSEWCEDFGRGLSLNQISKSEEELQKKEKTLKGKKKERKRHKSPNVFKYLEN